MRRLFLTGRVTEQYEGLDWMISWGPFQPCPFCESVGEQNAFRHRATSMGFFWGLVHLFSDASCYEVHMPPSLSDLHPQEDLDHQSPASSVRGD